MLIDTIYYRTNSSTLYITLAYITPYRLHGYTEHTDYTILSTENITTY